MLPRFAHESCIKVAIHVRGRNLVSQGLENSKSEACSDIQESAPTYTTDIFWNDGWNGTNGTMAGVLTNGMMTGVLLDGTEQTYDTSASSFSLGGLNVSATSSPKRIEWVKMNLDTGAAVNTFH